MLSEQIRRISADVLAAPIEEIRPDSSPESIAAWDSLHHLNLVLALEQEFGLQFTPEEIEQMVTIELIELLVAEKLSAGVER